MENEQVQVVIVDAANLKKLFALSDDTFWYLIREGMPRIEVPWESADKTTGGTHYLFDQGEVYRWLRKCYYKGTDVDTMNLARFG